MLFNCAMQQLDTNDFAPRLGVAYQMNEKTTIRTGVGVYYSQDTGNPVFDMGRNFGFRETANSNSDVRSRSTNLDDPWGNKPGGVSYVCSNWDGLCLAGLYTFANDARRRTPYVIQYLFNIQHQLNDTTLLEVGYAGNQGRKLQRMYGFNTPTFRADPTDLSTQAERRPWGGNIYNRLQTIGNVSDSDYDSLALKARQRHSNGFTYLLGYTWSRAIDRGSAIRTQSGDNLFPTNNYNLGLERGLSQFHTAHRFTGSLLYDIPLKFENRVLEAVAGGWQAGSIITLSTGTPRNVGNCGDLASHRQGNRGDSTQQPFNLPRGERTAERFFNADFSDNNAGHNSAALACDVPVTINGEEFNQLRARAGNVNRNPAISPGVINWDFSMMKNFRFTERYNLQFRFESFNFANHPNWNTPSTGRSSNNFGRVTTARAMRTNQFALKFIF